jgi:hypothetical protein
VQTINTVKVGNIRLDTLPINRLYVHRAVFKTYTAMGTLGNFFSYSPETDFIYHAHNGKDWAVSAKCPFGHKTNSGQDNDDYNPDNVHAGK